MTIRTAALTVAALMTGVATPALSQESQDQTAETVTEHTATPLPQHGIQTEDLPEIAPYPGGPVHAAAKQHGPMHAGAPYATDDHVSEWQGEWQGEWVAPDRYQGTWQGSYYSDDGRPYAPGLGYSRAQRDAWLQQCSDSYFYEARHDRDGAVVGGLVGAVAGGVIGNRVADRHRLRGTLIGAGLGGLAGAVVGDAIDDRGNQELADRAYDACEAYLAEYESRASGWGQPGFGYGYGPVYWVKVPIHRARRASCNCASSQQVVEEEVWEDVVVEEVVEEKIVTRTVPRRPVPLKTTKLQSAK